MTKVVGVINFEKELRRLLSEYGVEVRKIANDYVEEASDIAVKMLKEDSKKRTGEYASDWAKKEQYYRGLGTTYVVYNRKHYRLTHLLENPRKIKDRNRVEHGRTEGDHVIRDTRDYTESWLLDNIMKGLQL